MCDSLTCDKLRALKDCCIEYNRIIGIPFADETRSGAISDFITSNSLLLDDYRRKITLSGIDPENPTEEDLVFTLFPIFIALGSMEYDDPLRTGRFYSALVFFQAFLDRTQVFEIEEFEQYQDLCTLITSIGASGSELKKSLVNSISNAIPFVKANLIVLKDMIEDAKADEDRAGHLPDVDIPEQIENVFRPSITLPQTDYDEFDIENSGQTRPGRRATQSDLDANYEASQLMDFRNAVDLFDGIESTEDVIVDPLEIEPETLADYRNILHTIKHLMSNLSEDEKENGIKLLAEELTKNQSSKYVRRIRTDLMDTLKTRTNQDSSEII